MADLRLGYSLLSTIFRLEVLLEGFLMLLIKNLYTKNENCQIQNGGPIFRIKFAFHNLQIRSDSRGVLKVADCEVEHEK